MPRQETLTKQTAPRQALTCLTSPRLTFSHNVDPSRTTQQCNGLHRYTPHQLGARIASSFKSLPRGHLAVSASLREPPLNQLPVPTHHRRPDVVVLSMYVSKYSVVFISLNLRRTHLWRTWFTSCGAPHDSPANCTATRSRSRKILQKFGSA